jgi:hypothetical protein
VEDVDFFTGVDFWSHFAPRSSGELPPALAYAGQVTRGVDFEADVRTFTSEGRKIWLTCSFRSGSQSRVSALLQHVWLMLARLPQHRLCLLVRPVRFICAYTQACNQECLIVSHARKRGDATSVLVCSLPEPCRTCLILCTASVL